MKKLYPFEIEKQALSRFQIQIRQELGSSVKMVNLSFINPFDRL